MLQVRADGSGCGFDVGEVRVFRFGDRGWNCDYDEVGVPDVFGVVCEGDAQVIVRPGELPDSRILPASTSETIVGRCRENASASGSPT